MWFVGRNKFHLMSPEDDSASAVSDSLSGTRNFRTPDEDSSLAMAPRARTIFVGATGLNAMWRRPENFPNRIKWFPK